MTAPAFPVSQLGRPTVNYSLKPADLRVRADTVSGLANSYNGSNAALTTISVKWEWGADNYAVFQDWYRNDCKDGSIEFTIAEMYLFGSMGGLTARFTEPPKATYKSWNHYSVSATIETRTTDYITEATLDAAWTNAETSSITITAHPQSISVALGKSISLSVLARDDVQDAITFQTLFGNPSGDGYGEQAQSSSLRGKTEGYARPAMRRNSPITVTQVPVKWEMSQEKKILFDAWYHYKLVNGAAWFWIYAQFHGVWQYIKVRFVESISVEYEPVDWWKVSGTLETVEYNYLALADCQDLIAPSDAVLPVITNQPDSVAQEIGTTVTLSVTATTETGTLSYQWYLGSTAVSGATSSTYSFTLSDSNDGDYYVVVSNNVGHVTSNTATVAIDDNTVLLVQVDAAGNIVERTGNGTITTSGTVIVDHTTTHDGFGSIRNTVAGSTVGSGYLKCDFDLSITGDFTVEGWCSFIGENIHSVPVFWLADNSLTYPLAGYAPGWGDSNTAWSWSYNGSGAYCFVSYGTSFHHLAIARNSGIVKLFVDGNVEASVTDSTEFNIQTLRLGSYAGYVYQACCWENVRISNIARYTENFTPPERF